MHEQFYGALNRYTDRQIINLESVGPPEGVQETRAVLRPRRARANRSELPKQVSLNLTGLNPFFREPFRNTDGYARTQPERRFNFDRSL